MLGQDYIQFHLTLHKRIPAYFQERYTTQQTPRRPTQIQFYNGPDPETSYRRGLFHDGVIAVGIGDMD
jgi:hypothetical protein